MELQTTTTVTDTKVVGFIHSFWTCIQRTCKKLRGALCPVSAKEKWRKTIA